MAAPAAPLRRVGRSHLPQGPRLVGQLALSRPPQPLARMVRLSPAFGLTCLPGFATVPLADRVMAFVFRASTTTVCALSASVRLA